MEPVVCGILVGLIVIENVVAVDCPSAGNPLMELLVNDALLGKLIIEFLFCRHLELCVQSFALLIVVLVMMIIMTSGTSH